MLLVILFVASIDAASRYLVSRQFSRAEYYEYPTLIDDLGENSTIINLGGVGTIQCSATVI